MRYFMPNKYQKDNGQASVRCAVCRVYVQYNERCSYNPHAERGQKLRCLKCHDLPETATVLPENVINNILPPTVPTQTPILTEVKPTLPGLSEADVIELIRKHATTALAVEETPLPVDLLDRIALNGKHNQTPYIVTLLRMREYPFLFGAPGAGKTHLALSLAKDMGLPFVNISCSPDMFKSEIIGSVSPVNQRFFQTAFYSAWKDGGVILFDEICLASGAFVNILNAGLAQQEMLFPNGERIPMHSNCFLLFADNSAGYGNDPMFPERQDLGQAFRDRVSYVKFEYDTTLELQIITDRFNGDSVRANAWHTDVLKLRSGLESMANLPVFASPRFAYAGAKGFAIGLTVSQIVQTYLLRGLHGDVQKQVAPVLNVLKARY